MKRKIGLALSLGVIVAVLGAFLVAPALAQTPAPETPAVPAAPQAKTPRANPGYEALSTLLGMSVQDILSARQNGQTLSDIGKSKNVTDQQMIDALVSAHKTAIDEALTKGSITQAQHDWLLQATQTMAQLQVTNPFPMGRGGLGLMMGPGFGAGRMMGGFGDRGFGRSQGMPGRNRDGSGKEGFNYGFGRGGWSDDGNQNQPATPAPSATPSGA